MTLSWSSAPYELRFAGPVTTARGIAYLRRGLIVRLSDGGSNGFGEVAMWPGFGTDGLSLEGALDELGELSLPSRLPEQLEELETLVTARSVEIRAAVSTALIDLLARSRGVSVAALLADRPATLVPVGALARDVDDAGVRLRQGVRTLKIKIGGASISEDVERVRAIRRAAGSSVQLRVDANRAYSAAEAEPMCAALAALAVEFVEEPLAEPTPERLAALRASTGVRLAIDETVTEHATRFFDAACCDVVVIKPTFAGGPQRAVSLARAARRCGLAVTVGTAFESAVGRAAALHVAAALCPESACGLASPLADDLAELPAVIGGAMSLPLASGLGVTPRLGGWS